MRGTNYTVATGDQLRGATTPNSRPFPAPLDLSCTERPSNGKDIYFSPVAIPTSASRVELSDPLPTPELSDSTPTQASFDAAGGKRPLVYKRSKLRLGTRNLDRLVQALVRSELVKSCVRKRWWERDQAIPKHSSGPSTPLISSSLPTPPTSNASPKHSPTAETKPLQVKFRGVAITNAQSKGSPIRFVFKGYATCSNVLHVGSKAFLNSPYGNAIDSCIRIEAPTPASTDSKSKILIQAVSEVLDRWTGRVAFVLVAEFDMTESFASVALAELALQSGIGREYIESMTSSPASSTGSTEDVDWCALADELQTQCELDSIVDSATDVFAQLTLESCSPQTRQLLAEIEKIKEKHRDFLLVQSRDHTDPRTPGESETRIGVPCISRHFEWRIHDHAPVPEGERRAFRERIVAEVAKKGVAGPVAPFATRIRFQEEEKKVFCAPLMDCGKVGAGAWVCFVNDGS